MAAEQQQQRIFTVSDYLKPNARGGTVNLVYRGEDVTTLVEYIEPGATLEDPHWHPESAHVFVVVEGEGEALVGNGVWEPIRAGQFIIQPRNKVHAMRNPSNDKRMVYVCVDIDKGQYVVNESDEHHD